MVRKKENSAAAQRNNPRNRPPIIVAPDRDVPKILYMTIVFIIKKSVHKDEIGSIIIISIEPLANKVGIFAQ